MVGGGGRSKREARIADATASASMTLWKSKINLLTALSCRACTWHVRMWFMFMASVFDLGLYKCTYRENYPIHTLEVHVEADPDWHLNLQLPQGFSTRTVEAIKSGQLTRSSRSEFVQSVSKMMLNIPFI